ncbi:X-Pro aminopeptidase [Niabella ginsenosidivorans]|uniref:Xaa-Pro aminopeptidase n=1 Tax=Niabella ginsenosidivorans TaxID=1176587 RepID=A0A1A9I6W7_9BACT|nr:aminopeptidase P family protein [Niabella ginsenosidivorans]ANH82402.1 X-Pro aminopeptidase [Niabella ginsenosidivorans]
MKYLPLNPAIFIKNRKRFVDKMEKNSIALFWANDEMPENGDALYKYKPNSSIFWLSGIGQEDTMVILYPDHPDPKYREVLVLVRPNELKEKWDGRRLRAHEATAISGMKTVVWADALEGLLQGWIHSAQNIYLDTNENDRKGTTIETRQYRYIKELQAKYPLHHYLRAAPFMKELRAIKTPEEVEVINKAIAITETTFRRLLQFIKPGVWEFEIEAEIVHSFLSNRATREGYASIIASGDNARVLHYISNDQQCKDGDLILMDFGAEYGGYNADLTRTVPVNGRFTKRQRAVYDACLRIHRYCASILKPGISIATYHEKVGDQATKEFIKLGLLTKVDIKNEDPANRAYRRYLYHGISHHLGIDVHDLAPNFHTPLKAGMVLTIEPGIYIEEEQMGVRIENNFLLTRSGNVDLMKTMPIEADDIERLMNS